MTQPGLSSAFPLLAQSAVALQLTHLILYPPLPQETRHVSVKVEKTQAQENVQREDMTDMQRAAERNRKGRERSLRTRRRNAARLRILEQNCSYLQRENDLLKHLCHMLHLGNMDIVAALVAVLVTSHKSKPESYVIAEDGGGGLFEQEIDVREFVKLDSVSLQVDEIVALLTG